MRSCASSASADDRPDEEDRGPEQHESEQHHRERLEASNLFLAGGAECEEQKRGTGSDDQRYDDEARDEGSKKVLLHGVTLSR